MTPERDENGRFKKGQSGNPDGRPPKKREERFMEITLSACTYADWLAIVKKAIDQARRGNHTARKWLSDYLIGPASQRVDVTSGGERIGPAPEVESLAEALAALGLDGVASAGQGGEQP